MTKSVQDFNCDLFYNTMETITELTGDEPDEKVRHLRSKRQSDEYVYRSDASYVRNAC